MNTVKGLNTLNVRQQELYGYIVQYHPYMLDNPEELAALLVEKADAANKAYIDEYNESNNVVVAKEAGNTVLYSGLHFSPITYIEEIAWFRCNKELTAQEALAIYYKTETIFREYSPGDDFEGSDKEEELTEKLLPFIAN